MEKSLMTQIEQEEYDRVVESGSKYVGARKKGLYIPTIKLSNSDKNLKELGIPLGNFFLREKKGDIEKHTALGEVISGVILRVSYSIKSIYDPNGIVGYYSFEFENFFEDTIKVLDGKTKKPIFEGSYKQWKDENQITSSRGNKNDFVLQVHLYLLEFESLDAPRVRRLTFTGKSLSEWFVYSNGDKERGIASIYSQGIQPHNAVHVFSSTKDFTPKNEPYWYISFAFIERLDLASVKKVVAIQRELDAQIQQLRTGIRPEKEVQPERLSKPDNSEVRDDEINVEEVPF